MGNGGPDEARPVQFVSYRGPVGACFDIRTDWHPIAREPVENYFDLKSKIQVFSDELEQILFIREAPSPRHRHCYFVALTYLTEFLRQIGFSEAVAYELNQFSFGLTDLDRGIVRHYFAPSSVEGVGNRPALPSDVWMAKAHVAIAVDIAVNGGFAIPRKRAAREIAKAYGFLADVLAPGTTNFASAIESWHRQFAAGTVSDDEAQRRFDRRAQFIACWDGRGDYLADASPEYRKHADAIAAHYGILADAAYLAAKAASPEVVEKARRNARASPISTEARTKPP